jgi:phosphatidylserine decarboxylase
MERKQAKFRINWFWGFIGCLGILGFILKEPGYYAFFAFFLFFLEPVVRSSRKSKQKS